MSLSVAQIVIDCTNAEALAGFWSQALDRPVDPGANPFFSTIGRGSPSALMFIQVPEPKRTKNRLHLDLTGPRWQEEAERVRTLGATLTGEYEEHGTRWVSLRDPEGNEFDIGAGIGSATD